MHSMIFALAALSTAPVQVMSVPVPPAPPQVHTIEIETAVVSALEALAVLDVLGSATEIAEWASELHFAGLAYHEAERLPRESWLPQDPADSLWRAARTALDNGEPRRAAELYQRLRTERRFASSDYRPHAFYWEAYARQRLGGTQELRSAQQALGELRRSYPNFENMVEVDRLQTRINADLARGGDRGAIERQRAQAERATEQCPDQEVRVSVVESLLTMASEDAMPLLARVMERRDDCSAPLREKAVFIISQQKSAQAEDILLNAARQDPSPKVREQAVFWLSQVNSEKSLDAIQDIIRTERDPKLLEQAVFAASQHRSPRAAQILRDVATRGDAPEEARKNAIFWLGQSRSQDVPAFMRELYSSVRETELKESVLFALSQNRDPQNAAFLLEVALNDREPLELRKSALFWAGQQGQLPLARLGELYRSVPDREMRESIIFAISQRRDPEAVEQLIEIARAERDVELKKTAIFWLGQSKDPRAVRYLAEVIGS